MNSPVVFDNSNDLGFVLMEVVGGERPHISEPLYHDRFTLCGFLAMEAHHVLPLVNFEHALDSKIHTEPSCFIAAFNAT